MKILLWRFKIKIICLNYVKCWKKINIWSWLAHNDTQQDKGAAKHLSNDEKCRRDIRMTNKKDSLDNQVQNDGLQYLTKQDVDHINEGFQILQIENPPNYTCPYKFSKNLQKVSNLQYEGIKFFTSGSTLTPKFSS